MIVFLLLDAFFKRLPVQMMPAEYDSFDRNNRNIESVLCRHGRIGHYVHDFKLEIDSRLHIQQCRFRILAKMTTGLRKKGDTFQHELQQHHYMRPARAMSTPPGQRRMTPLPVRPLILWLMLRCLPA
jgi:hypothetical protein